MRGYDLGIPKHQVCTMSVRQEKISVLDASNKKKGKGQGRTWSVFPCKALSLRAQAPNADKP